MGGSSSKGDPYLLDGDRGLNETGVEREIRFSYARANSSLSSAISTFSALDEDKPLPLCQVGGFIALWVSVVCLLGAYVFMLADPEVQQSTVCSLVILHLVVVGLAIVGVVAIAATRTQAWRGEVRHRNRRPSMSTADSSVLMRDQQATVPQGLCGSMCSGEAKTWHDGEQPKCCSRAGMYQHAPPTWQRICRCSCHNGCDCPYTTAIPFTSEVCAAVSAPGSVNKAGVRLSPW